MFALIPSVCDKWSMLPRPGLPRDTNRFGHSAVVSNGWGFFPSRTWNTLPLYICGVSLSLFTELLSSYKESIQLVNDIHGQIIHFQWIIHLHTFLIFFSFFFFFTFPWCLAASSEFWNPQPISDFSLLLIPRLCACIVFSLCLLLISMLNLVYCVSFQFSHCWLLQCFRTTPHFTHRASFSCCALSVLFCFFSWCTLQAKFRYLSIFQC